jgi:hypothetical protein
VFWDAENIVKNKLVKSGDYTVIAVVSPASLISEDCLIFLEAGGADA